MRILFPAIAALLACGCYNRPTTPLIGAARAGDIDSVRYLIERGADPDERGGVNDWTPLMHAVHKHQTGSAIALIKGGAHIDARMRNGETALMMAAGYGYADMVRALLDRGADPRLTTPSGDSALTLALVGSTDIDEFTAGNCQTETVRVLLERAPEMKLGGRLSGRAAKWLAKHAGCREVLAMVNR